MQLHFGWRNKLKDKQILKSCCLYFDIMKQTNWTQMFNKKSTNMLLLLRNCASKNSLKTLFKVIAQAKISLNKGVFVLFLLSISVQFVCFIFLLHDAKICSSKSVFVIAIGIFWWFYNFLNPCLCVGLFSSITFGMINNIRR